MEMNKQDIGKTIKLADYLKQFFYSYLSNQKCSLSPEEREILNKQIESINNVKEFISNGKNPENEDLDVFKLVCSQIIDKMNKDGILNIKLLTKEFPSWIQNMKKSCDLCGNPFIPYLDKDEKYCGNCICICPFCKSKYPNPILIGFRDRRITESDCKKYLGGLVVQKAFPKLRKFEREMLISGLCLDCQKSTFGGFSKCVNCGEEFPKSDLIEGILCSDKCEKEYRNYVEGKENA